MATRRIILDCDPGVDDAIALLLALASPDEIELIGVTTVAGNVPLLQTEQNARRVCALAHRERTAVVPGCARPIMRAERARASVHGGDGLGDIGLANVGPCTEGRHAVDFIIDAVAAAPGTVTLCAIGPLTNVAVALIKCPGIAAQIDEIVFMGGAAFCAGNVTPEAEFNIWFDPHAAEVVLDSGIPLTMFGLDVTRQVRITDAHLAPLSRVESAVTDAAVRLLRSYGQGDGLLHDPCVIAHLIAPDLFDGVAARVSVECASTLTEGRTVAAVAPRHLNGQATNCRVVTRADAAGFFALLAERLARL